MKTFASIVTALLASGSLWASAAEHAKEPHLYYSLVPGRYAVIGQFPDGGAVYQGAAEITYQDNRLHLVKHLKDKVITATGTVERADPGETDVVRFRWPEHAATCLVQVDLDNYSRLSCYWTVKGVEHKKPGLEAYFPTATWP